MAPRPDRLSSTNSCVVNFRESEAYLLSLGNEVETMKLGLENIRTLLAALGNPENSYKKVQVAGTNGKGSVCAFLNSICLEAGIKTGLFTSPHLVSITERIRIDGRDINEDEFARLATRVRETAEKLVTEGSLETVPTYFEQVTAIALVAFAEANVQLAILETGLGGRYDATTAANAEIAAITRIDLDHQEYLGNTIEEIAAEKAAIIQEGSKAVVGEQSDDALAVILEQCLTNGVVPKLATQVRTARVSGWLSFETEIAEYRVNEPGLVGAHQIENAGIAVLLAETLSEQFPITNENIIDGLQNARHPGRLEWMDKFLFDGAHNPAGAKALRAYLDEFVHQPITMIFGAMSDKNIAGIAEMLFPIADTLILTKPENSRAMSVDELSKHLPADFDLGKVIRSDSVSDAVLGVRNVTPSDGIILVTGSLYLIGEVKRLLNN